MFAGRGISLDAVQTASGPPPTLTLRFRATAQVTDYLTRRLLRIRNVVRVEAIRASG